MNCKPKEYFWTEKYRPSNINDLIIPEDHKRKFETVLQTGELDGYVFSGEPGLGKTSCAKALCEMLDLEYIIINGSEKSSRGIAGISEIIDYGSTCSINGKYKVVIIDEGEKLTHDAQDALKNVEEELKSNLRIIITTNDFNKIDDALMSRLVHIDFNMDEKQKKEIMKPLMSRIYDIFDNEGITYNKNNKKLIKYVVDIIKHRSDIRHIIKSLSLIAKENNMSIPDDYEFPVEIVTYENITKILNSDYKEIARYADTCDPNSVFSFIGKNVLKFSNDINVIRRLMNATVGHERDHLTKINKLNNMIAYFLNIKEILK